MLQSPSQGPMSSPSTCVNRAHSHIFAHTFTRAYQAASPKIKEVIEAMCLIVNDKDATHEERESALDTLNEALFPMSKDGEYGVALEKIKILPTDEGQDHADAASLNAQEAHFANRVNALMKKRGLTQAVLAERIGVGQPAVSMILNRECRPQRRTVKKIADALGVTPAEIWHEFDKKQD